VSSAEVDSLDGQVGGRPGVSKGAPVGEIARRIAEVIAAG
jgi:hypothetical protein